MRGGEGWRRRGRSGTHAAGAGLSGSGRSGGSRWPGPGVLAALVGVTLGALVVAVATGAGPFASVGFLGTHDASHATPDPAPVAVPGVTDPVPVAAPSVLPVAPLTDGPLPTTAGLQAALASALKAKVLGSSVGLVVMDPVGGQTLYGVDGTRPQTPASTMKLVTAASVLHFLGPDATLRTRTVAGAAPGEVVLVGGGDPTITTTGGGPYPQVASLDALARQTADALKASATAAATTSASPSSTASRPRAGRAPAVRLVLDDSLFTGPRTAPGWAASDLADGLIAPVSALTLDEDRVAPSDSTRYADPTAAAGRAFAAALAADGVRVTATTRGVAPAGARQLGSVSSPPVSALVERMLLQSDDDLAEALAHLAGVAAGTGGSFAGGAAASGQALTWLGVDPAGSVIVNGSGISRSDRLDAELVGSVVAGATESAHPELAPLLSGLPVAGVSGTLVGRFDTAQTAVARGRVRAKTGTLTGVSGLAGTVLDRDGRMLVFVVIADRASVYTLQVRAALDQVAATLENCGCR